MNIFYINTNLEHWAAASVSDEELQMLLDSETNRRYSDFLDVLV